MTSPDPVPLPFGPLAAIVTTEGMTLSATEVTGQALAVDEDVEVTGVTLDPDDCVAPTMRPPTNAPHDQRRPQRHPEQPPAWASRMPGLAQNGPYPGR